MRTTKSLQAKVLAHLLLRQTRFREIQIERCSAFGYYSEDEADDDEVHFFAPSEARFL